MFRLILLSILGLVTFWAFLGLLRGLGAYFFEKAMARGELREVLREIPPKVMLSCGILEEYWDSEFTQFYAHAQRWAEMEPRIREWNKRYPDKVIELDNNVGTKALETSEAYAKNLHNARKHGISMLFWGPNGTGKTMLASCILKEGIRQGYSVQMSSLGGIIEMYAEGWSNPEKREMFNERIKNVDFLLIDDVGKEYRAKSSDLVEVAFDNLIRYRSFRRKPFILTTNTDIARLQSTYGQSLASLLQGKCMTVPLGGVDYRKVIQAKDLRSMLEGN